LTTRPLEGEQFIGGIASAGMTRTTRSFKSRSYIQTGGPVGYGIYLTDHRFIGVSYTKIASKAYRPAMMIFIIWIISLILLVVYAKLTGAQELPPLPFVMGLAVVDLILLVYWSPKQASNRIERVTITTIEELQRLRSDIILDRADISRVTVQPTLTTITMKSGELHTFLSKLRGRKLQQLLSLLKEFCSLTPSIDITVSDSSGKNVQRLVFATSKESSTTRYGGFGQTVDLTFLSTEEITLDDLRGKLAELSVALKKGSSTLDWVEWTRPSGKQVTLAANTHHGLNQYWVVLGFDNKELRMLSLDERKSFVDDFLELGKRLWSDFAFAEGILAPEEEGLLFSILKEEKFPPEALRSNYASFLSQKMAESIHVLDWVSQKFPQALLQPLPREGFLIVWDSTKDGLARFLESEFHIA